MSASANRNRRHPQRRPTRVYNDYDDREYHEAMDEDEPPRSSPSKYYDDDYYAKNDAGEYVWQ